MCVCARVHTQVRVCTVNIRYCELQAESAPQRRVVYTVRNPDGPIPLHRNTQSKLLGHHRGSGDPKLLLSLHKDEVALDLTEKHQERLIQMWIRTENTFSTAVERL